VVALGAPAGIDAGMWFLVAEFGAFVTFAVVWGAASDALGRRAPLIVAGALGGAASYIALAAVPEFEFGFRAALAVRVVGGALTIGAFSLAITSLMDLRGGNGRNMGTAGVAIGLGAAVGSVVGGALADLNAFYPVYAGAAVLAGQGYSRLPSTTRSSPIGGRRERRPERRGLPRRARSGADDPRALRPTRVRFRRPTHGRVLRARRSLLLPGPRDVRPLGGGGGSDARALLRPLRGAAGPVRLAFGPSGALPPRRARVDRVRDRHYRRRCGAGLPVAAALMVLVGVCGALMAPATMALVTDLVEPEARGAAMGLFNVFGSLGFLAGRPHRRERHRSVRLHARVPRGRRARTRHRAGAVPGREIDRAGRRSPRTRRRDWAVALGVTLPPPDMRWCGRPSRALFKRPSLPYGRQMDILVVGAGEIGRWIADTVLADESPIDATVAFTDRDPAVADDAAAGRDAEAIPVDSDTTHDAVCLAVPMSAVPAAVEAYASRAERAILDVSGEMTDAIAAMREHAPDRERASYHPLFAPPRVPGNVAAVVDEGGPVVEEITAAIEAGGNEVFETTPAEHDEAMETVQAGAHAAVLAWRLAGDDVREEFHTPVSAALDEVADTVTEGSPEVYAEIQRAFDGADDVAAAAREIADSDSEAFAALYERARGDREGRERHE